MEKVVVVGGSGFMGSHTADELSNRGFSVTIFDIKKSPWIRDDQQFVEGNMLHLDELSYALKDAKYLYHFGGIADIGEAGKRPFDTINLNVMSAAVAMEAATEADIDRIIYASTMYVYSPYGSFYRASKQASEIIIEAYNEKFDIDYTLLRYGSLYGQEHRNGMG